MQLAETRGNGGGVTRQFREVFERFVTSLEAIVREAFDGFAAQLLRLIVDLLLANDEAALTGTGIIRTVYDPACGAEAHGRRSSAIAPNSVSR
jgi:hypothetical protein